MGVGRGSLDATCVACADLWSIFAVKGWCPCRPGSHRRRFPKRSSTFQEWLRRHRGLAISTVTRYQLQVAKMLPALGQDAALYDAALIRRVFLAQVRGLSRGYAKCFAPAVRAYLRFLAVQGPARPYWDRAVPTRPEWRRSALPRSLASAEVERVIGACDVRSACGIRDRAVLLLLARLGLRAGDIFSMTLDDIDWDAGTVRVRATSRRDLRLPLPQDVGDAILTYLARARPTTPLRRLCWCTNAPVRPLATLASVSDIVRVALARAEIRQPPLTRSPSAASLRGDDHAARGPLR